ncbi:MAG: hypothetical protein II834_09490 [Bacteroidaceae bacterium]|nr:hypothetical protein [Bacteroidaceae bacterium]
MSIIRLLNFLYLVVVVGNFGAHLLESLSEGAFLAVVDEQTAVDVVGFFGFETLVFVEQKLIMVDTFSDAVLYALSVWFRSRGFASCSSSSGYDVPEMITERTPLLI